MSSHSGLSSGCRKIGATTASRSAGATRQWSSWAWVSRIALTLRPPTTVEDGVDRVRGVDHHALVVVPDHPDVVVDVEGLAVEAERPADDGVVDPRVVARHQRMTTERSTSPSCIRSNAASTSSERDLLGDERVEVEPALLVEVDEHREVAGGQAVAVPAGLQRATAAEDVDERDVGHLHVGGRYADEHDRPGQVAGVERLLPGVRAADRLDDDVRAEPAGELLDRGDRVGRRRVDGVGRAHPLGGVELLGVDVDGDDRRRTGQRATRDRGHADAAAADDRDRLAAGRLAGVDRRAEPGHHAAAEQADRRRPAPTGRPWCTGRRRPASSRRTRRCPAPARARCPSSQRHLLGGVVGREAVPRLAAVAGPAVAAHRAPVEDHEVAGRHRRDVGTDRLDDAGGLVAEQEREVVVDPALAVVQVGVAHPAGLHLAPAPRPARGRAR